MRAFDEVVTERRGYRTDDGVDDASEDITAVCYLVIVCEGGGGGEIHRHDVVLICTTARVMAMHPLQQQSPPVVAAFESWRSNTPPATRIVIGTVVIGFILDALWGGTFSAAFALAAYPDTLRTFFDVYRLFTSMFTPVRGIFAFGYSLYIGNELLGKYEKAIVNGAYGEIPVQATSNPSVAFCAMVATSAGINLLSISLKWIWFGYVFPKSALSVGVDDDDDDMRGWTGGMLPLLVYITTFLTFRAMGGGTRSGNVDEDLLESHEDVPFFPFSVKRRHEGLAYAFLFMMLGGGDVDLFVGWALARSIAFREMRGEETTRMRLREAAAETVERRVGGGGS